MKIRVQRAIVGICIGNALCLCALSAPVIWVSALARAGWASLSQTGWLVSGTLLFCAFGSLSTSALASRLNPRVAATTAAAAIVFANLLNMIANIYALSIGTLLMGLGAGVLVAIVNGAAARTERPRQTFALLTAAGMLCVSAMYLVSSGIIKRFGPAGFFGLFVAFGILAACIVFWTMPASPAPASAKAPTVRTGGLTLASLIGCVALSLMAMALSPVTVYLMTFGIASGLSTSTMSVALALATPLTLVGVAIVALLGDRVGLLPPLVASLVIVGASSAVIISGLSPLAFYVALVLFEIAAGACTPCALGFISHLDPSGRAASAAPGFILIVAAVGAKLGSVMMGITSFPAMTALVVFCLSASLLLFITASQLSGVSRTARRARPIV